MTRDGSTGARMFGAEAERADDRNAFAASAAKDDRHHFRFIVSPEDAPEMGDLKGFTRELMTRMEADLGARLDWRAVEHWNTDNPHVHIIVRGIGEDGQNLVISRDYIGEGMRATARDIVTRELGLRSDLDIRQSLERQVEAERWTEIDRDLSRTMQRDGLIDMAPEPGVRPDGDHALRMGRLRKLERLGLATEIGPGQWTIAADAQGALRALGERDDIIKRMHKAMSERGIDRGAANYVLDADPAQPVIGKLVDRGLHDELTGARLCRDRRRRTGAATMSGCPASRRWSIARRSAGSSSCARSATAGEPTAGPLATRSDIDLAAQVSAPGATWLDHRPDRARRRRLRTAGSAPRCAARWTRAPIISSARGWRGARASAPSSSAACSTRSGGASWMRLARRSAGETGLAYRPTQAGEKIAGVVRQRLALASGRFAMIDDGLGFRLVPWASALEQPARPSGVRRRRAARRRSTGRWAASAASASEPQGDSPCPRPKSSGARSSPSS